jgi:hypothetical protein
METMQFHCTHWNVPEHMMVQDTKNWSSIWKRRFQILSERKSNRKLDRAEPQMSAIYFIDTVDFLELLDRPPSHLAHKFEKKRPHWPKQKLRSWQCNEKLFLRRGARRNAVGHLIGIQSGYSLPEYSLPAWMGQRKEESRKRLHLKSNWTRPTKFHVCSGWRYKNCEYYEPPCQQVNECIRKKRKKSSTDLRKVCARCTENHSEGAADVATTPASSQCNCHKATQLGIIWLRIKCPVCGLDCDLRNL